MATTLCQIKTCTDCRASEAPGVREHEFEVVAADRTYRLATSDGTSYSAWMTALVKVIKNGAEHVGVSEGIPMSIVRARTAQPV